MKKTLLIAALTMISASAFASKARVNALQGAAHINDSYDVLAKPDKAMLYGDSVVLEFGTAAAATAATSTSGNAEGMFIRKMDNAAWGLYLGNQTVSGATYRALDAKFLGMENAVNLIYAMGMGDMDFGAGLYYSKSSRKPDAASVATPEKAQDAMGLYVSASSKMGWDGQFSFGLANNAKWTEVAGTETSLKGKTSMRLSGGYWMDTMYLNAFYGQGGAKSETGATTNFDRSDSAMGVGVMNSHKKDGSEFFYGASYVMGTYKDSNAGGGGLNAYGAGTEKVEFSKIPLIMGMEIDANSWLSLRGSLTQNFFIDSSAAKNATATTMKNDNGDSTAVAAGASLKFGKLTMDGVLQANGANNGAFGSDSAGFLAQTSFSYMF